MDWENLPSTLTPVNAPNLKKITDSGSNTNGNYIKFQDGTLIQWGQSSFPSGTYNDASYKIVPFPISFYSNTYKMIPTMYYQSTVANNYCLGVNLIPGIVNTSSCTIYRRLSYLAPTDSGQDNLYAIEEGFDWVAIGRWKA